MVYLEIVTCDSSIYKMDQPDFIVCGFMENSICVKRVKVVMLPTYISFFFQTKNWKTSPVIARKGVYLFFEKENSKYKL